MTTIAAAFIGLVLDAVLGDPRWLPHPVVGMGKTITKLGGWLRRRFPATPAGQRATGRVLAIALPVGTFVLSGGILFAAWLINFWASFILSCIMCYQVLAMGELRKQSMRVIQQLHEGGLDAARHAVGQIVGRDTACLSTEGVVRATVETVAENASDGVVAPLFYLMIGGAPLAMAYKAINTLDSMVGYKNDDFIDFGRASAKLDDAANWIPARLDALAMVAMAGCVGLSTKGAWRIWRRDHANHASPNSAQTESACAGALGVQLAGDASYFGKVVHKPTIGDDLRPIETDDVRRANRLMVASSLLAFAVFALVRAGICWAWGAAMAG